jgi:hypothetical protein
VGPVNVLQALNRAGEVTQVIQHLPSKHEVLISKPSIAKKKVKFFSNGKLWVQPHAICNYFKRANCGGLYLSCGVLAYQKQGPGFFPYHQKKKKA